MNTWLVGLVLAVAVSLGVGILAGRRLRAVADLYPPVEPAGGRR